MKKALKTIAFALVAIVAIALIVPAFLPSSIHVSKSIAIDRPASEVYAVLTDFDQSKHWDPWVLRDPQIKTTVTGEGLDAKYTWDGPVVGAGELTFIELNEPSDIRVAIKIIRPMEDEFTAAWDLEQYRPLTPPPDGPSLTTESRRTRATWSMDADLSYIERYFGSMIQDMIAADYEEGLANLKKYVESKPSDAEAGRTAPNVID